MTEICDELGCLNRRCSKSMGWCHTHSPWCTHNTIYKCIKEKLSNVNIFNPRNIGNRIKYMVSYSRVWFSCLKPYSIKMNIVMTERGYITKIDEQS